MKGFSFDFLDVIYDRVPPVLSAVECLANCRQHPYFVWSDVTWSLCCWRSRHCRPYPWLVAWLSSRSRVWAW